MKDIAVLGSPIIIFMLSSNQIAGFFDHQYLRKQCTHILDFLRGDFTKKRYHMRLSLVVGCLQACLTTPKFADIFLVSLWLILGAFPGRNNSELKIS